MLEVAIDKSIFWSSTMVIYPCLSPAVARNCRSLRKSPCLFVSLYRHISLCIPASWTSARSSLLKNPYWFDSHYRHNSLRRPGRWTRGSNSLRNNVCWFKSLYRYYTIYSPGFSTRASIMILKNYVGSSPTNFIFLHVICMMFPMLHVWLNGN